MTEQFDPYLKWLGIAPKDQPPHHYRLLGIELYESDEDVISNASDQRMSFVREHQSGKHSDQCQQILNGLAKARVCLLDPESKSEYDSKLYAVMEENRKQEVQAYPASGRPSVNLGETSENIPTIPAPIRTRKQSCKSRKSKKAKWYSNPWILTIVVVAVCLGSVYLFINNAIQKQKEAKAAVSGTSSPDTDPIQGGEGTLQDDVAGDGGSGGQGESGENGSEDEVIDVTEQAEPTAPPQDERLPMPTQGAIQTALSNLEGIYENSVDAAGSDPTALYFLNRRFLREAQESKPGKLFYSPEKTVATWVLHADVAAEAGDSRSVVEAAKCLASLFKTDESYLLEKCLPNVDLDGPSTNLIAYDMALAAETALKNGKPDLALSFLEIAEDALNNSQDSQQVDELISRHSTFRCVAQFREKLDIESLQDRDEMQLSEEEHKYLGWFLCFLCNNWEAGLPHLAASNADEVSCAKLELALSSEPTFSELKDQADKWMGIARRVPLLDSWEAVRNGTPALKMEIEALFERMRDLRKNNIRCHAAKLYQCALDQYDETSPDWDEEIELQMVQFIESGRSETPPFLAAHFLSTVTPGRLGCRKGEYRAEAARTRGLSTTGELALQAALKWIVDQQLSDGEWYGEAGEAPCGGAGLAMLPLLIEYPVDRRPEILEATDAGLTYLLESRKLVQPPPAYVISFFEPEAQHMHSHSLATIALCEHVAILPDSLHRRIGVAAVDFIVGTQNDDGGWGLCPAYNGEKASSSDMRSFALNVMALHAAQHAGIAIDDSMIEGAKEYLASLRMSRTTPSGRPVETERYSNSLGGYRKFRGSPFFDKTSTAAGALCEILLDDVQDPGELSHYVDSRIGADDIDDPLYNWAVTWIFAEWVPERMYEWIGPFQDRLIEEQVIRGEDTGSWTSTQPLEVDETDSNARRFQATCVYAIILQTAYRYPRKNLKSAPSSSN
jgi:hypothetical protein